MTDEQYIDAADSMFGGPDESEIRCQTVKVIKVRAAHRCMCPALEHGQQPHEVMPGERAVRDKALVDGEWGACYVCLPCLESWWKHIARVEDDKGEIVDWCTHCDSLKGGPACAAASGSSRWGGAKGPRGGGGRELRRRMWRSRVRVLQGRRGGSAGKMGGVTHE